MQMINWPELQPPPADLAALSKRLQEALPLRNVCRLLVEITLRAYPWTGRVDLISCYHPSQTYKQGQKIALCISDSQNVRPTVWLSGQVKDARMVENPIQGRFQVLTLDVHGKQIHMAGGIADATYPELDLSKYTSEEFAWLVKWVSDTYAASLQATVKRLTQKGQICGGLAGETFLPEHLSAVSPELLHPLFARLSTVRPWISLGEIQKDLPDLSPLERETVLGLLGAALKASPYRSLGGNRWTTHELFKQLNREVPRGLPTPPIPSNGSTWTKQDEQDLAGYDSQFMPMEARRALEELGITEPPSGADGVPWRPPKDSLRLPALSYLHITQGYFPVQSLRSAFAPDVQLVFVQFLDGEHQPFLLDRENGLLKAVHPEELHTKIVEVDIPVGTYLWLEYQGSERYRIAPQPLPFKRRVPCKLAHLDDGQLHIEHTHTSMSYAGDPSLFKANISREEIQALFGAASRVQLSVRETMMYAIQEICATDPDHRAHWLDIFNAVFLQRMCSPTSVAVLLYSQPCFESLGGGNFRYKAMPDTIINIHKRTDRLSQLWEDLLSDPVAPRPVAEKGMVVGARLEVRYSISLPFAPDPELPSALHLAETEPEISTARSYTAVEEEQLEPILLGSYEPDSFTPTDETEPVSSTWKSSLGKLFHSLVEPEDGEPSPLSADEANSEGETLSDMPIEAAHEASLSFSSPFHWEPKPAWINPATQRASSLPNTPDPRRFVSRPKIPLRPFHKQRFYRRAFFYLRSWLSNTFQKTT